MVAPLLIHFTVSVNTQLGLCSNKKMHCMIRRIASEEVSNYIRSGNECPDRTSDICHNDDGKRFKKTVSKKSLKAEYVL